MPDVTVQERKPRYRWGSPQDWLGDRINNLLHEAQLGPVSLKQDAAIAGLATIANTIVNGTLAVDSDTVQDAFQDEMDEDHYFMDLDKPVPVLYELEPIGADGDLEANGIVYYFCTETCRDAYQTDAEVATGALTAGSPEVDNGTVCDECGNTVT